MSLSAGAGIFVVLESLSHISGLVVGELRWPFATKRYLNGNLAPSRKSAYDRCPSVESRTRKNQTGNFARHEQ